MESPGGPKPDDESSGTGISSERAAAMADTSVQTSQRAQNEGKRSPQKANEASPSSSRKRAKDCSLRTSAVRSGNDEPPEQFMQSLLSVSQIRLKTPLRKSKGPISKSTKAEKLPRASTLGSKESNETPQRQGKERVQSLLRTCTAHWSRGKPRQTQQEVLSGLSATKRLLPSKKSTRASKAGTASQPLARAPEEPEEAGCGGGEPEEGACGGVEDDRDGRQVLPGEQAEDRNWGSDNLLLSETSRDSWSEDFSWDSDYLLSTEPSSLTYVTDPDLASSDPMSPDDCDVWYLPAMRQVIWSSGSLPDRLSKLALSRPPSWLPADRRLQ